VRLAVAGQEAVDDETVELALTADTSSLSGRHQAAIALADALMTRPGDMSDDLVDQLHAEFSDEELVELTLKVMKFNIQKVMVALGTDFVATEDDVARWGADSQFRLA
jgi:alkylhydroperoxidase family enzyme